MLVNCAMPEKIAVHHTAFVTAYFRASNTELSGDIYADMWTDESTRDHALNYVSAVSEYEPMAHCLRNRFILDLLTSLYAEEKLGVLINFGSGFSMYPYLLPDAIEHIEIDLPHLVDYKKEKLNTWVAQGRLPHRNISFMGQDFTSSLDQLPDGILKLKSGKPSFILLEGVVFFLNRESTLNLMELFGRIQQTGEMLGSVSFCAEEESNPAFKLLISYMKENWDPVSPFQYQTMEKEDYKAIPGYHLVHDKDTISEAAKYIPGALGEREKLLNEHFYILKKD